MVRGISRDMSIHLAWQDMRLSLVAEGVSWSPDVAQDMVNRMHEGWHNTLLELHRFGMLANDDDTDADEFGPTPDKELIEPHIVRLMDEDGLDG
jgi:hypothetical protein